MIYNGNKIILEQEIVLLDFLFEHNYDVFKIAVELNNQIILKADYKNVILRDSDKIEVVSFVGGG